MNLAADMGRHSGRATPSLHDDPYRQIEKATGRRSTYPLPIHVQTNRATSLLTAEHNYIRLSTCHPEHSHLFDKRLYTVTYSFPGEWGVWLTFRRNVSGRNSRPTTSVIIATPMGYHSPA